MSTYLVTGAAGFIGAAIAKRLIDEGHRVVTIDNLSTGFKKNIPDKVEFIHGDCGNSDVYQKLPDYRYDAIFHIAGQSSGEISFDDPIYDIRTNAESTLLLLQFALKNQCNRFIYASTMSVYGAHSAIPINEETVCHPQSFYGVAKLASEHYLRIYQQYGINSTCLRLFNVYGPGQNLENLRQGMVSIFLAQLMSQKRIHVKGAADRFRDFIYIDDVVEAFNRCLDTTESHGENINVATGTKTTVGELIEHLFSATNIKSMVEYTGNTAGDIHGIFADTSKFRNILNMKEYTSIDEGIKKMWQWASALN